MLNAFQSKYIAHKLTALDKNSQLSVISQGLMDAQVDLTPHQLEAASFALKNPLSNGVLLADEVGLGKTIEASILLCQMWAERKRHLLIICPASLREQWSIELEDKFNLPSVILERKNYLPSLLSLDDRIMIMSYNFAARIASDLARTSWDLVVIDEAHKLRNAYRESNKIGKAIKQALEGRKKILLTATPFQNSLMELYGLTTIIDENIFGDEKSFRAQYSSTDKQYNSLRERLSAYCKRTLRSQVSEYVNYTKRKAITFPFYPSKEELELFNSVARFLQDESVYAIPPKQRHLISLVLYKLLASSSNAVNSAFETILKRLEKIRDDYANAKGIDINELIDDDDLEDFYADEFDESEETPLVSEEIDIKTLCAEIAQIKKFIEISKAIKTDKKSDQLLIALKNGFEELSKMGANQKALIFTESRKTQTYLNEFLSQNGYAGKIILFHGANKSMRNEILKEFENDAQILIATEAGAEGLNMQFCSLVVNYDLPWNPQRVEQRIGRCHRYGQKFDVVVVNFVNQSNPADKRIFDLLNLKFKLFEGVFGVSDEVLGSVEDGVDFERKILEIYQTCRSAEEIEEAFNRLQSEMESAINIKMKQTKKMLLADFDAVVHQRLRVNFDESKVMLNSRQKAFWELAKSILREDGIFSEKDYSFELKNSEIGKCQKYYFLTQDLKQDAIPSAQIIRLSHAIGEKIIEMAKNAETPYKEITFDLSNAAQKFSYLDFIKEESPYGICKISLLRIESFETEEYLIISGITNSNKEIPSENMEQLFMLNAVEEKPIDYYKSFALDEVVNKNLKEAKLRSENRNLEFFKEEKDKIEQFLADKLYSVERELVLVKERIRSLEREANRSDDLERHAVYQDEIAKLSKQKRKLRGEVFKVEDEIDEERGRLIENLKRRLSKTVEVVDLMEFQWKLV